MPDSVRIKEIHEALQAEKFARDDKNPQDRRVANLGYYIERIARVLGISVNSNGTIRSIRQSKAIPQGGTIPPGWSIGQWGTNKGGGNTGQLGGNADEERDGLAYEVRCNSFDVDPYTGTPTKISEGGYVLVENFFQLFHIVLDDLDKALGWQEAGANVLPNPNREDKYISYEGLNSLLAENTYMLSSLSRSISGTHISSLITQAVVYEILTALGLPVSLKEFKVGINDDLEAKVPYPGLNPNAPSITDLHLWTLANIAPLVASKLQFFPRESDEQKEQDKKDDEQEKKLAQYWAELKKQINQQKR